VDAYTDGVLAISATLIILDIGSCECVCERPPPPSSRPPSLLFSRRYGNINTTSCSDGDVYNYLYDRRSQFSAYAVSFVLICSLLWTRHASMWKHVKQCGIVLHFLNTQVCAFIALLPFSIELMMNYTDTSENRESDERRHAVIFWLANVLFISVLIFCLGALILSKYHSLPRASDEKFQKRATRVWLLLSGLLLPFWTIAGILVCCFNPNGEQAWKISIGMQIFCHPISQGLVFWMYERGFCRRARSPPLTLHLRA
jgi:uncharacterized membrane protein